MVALPSCVHVYWFKVVSLILSNKKHKLIMPTLKTGTELLSKYDSAISFLKAFKQPSERDPSEELKLEISNAKGFTTAAAILLVLVKKAPVMPKRQLAELALKTKASLVESGAWEGAPHCLKQALADLC